MRPITRTVVGIKYFITSPSSTPDSHPQSVQRPQQVRATSPPGRSTTSGPCSASASLASPRRLPGGLQTTCRSGLSMGVVRTSSPFISVSLYSHSRRKRRLFWSVGTLYGFFEKTRARTIPAITAPICDARIRTHTESANGRHRSKSTATHPTSPTTSRSQGGLQFGDIPPRPVPVFRGQVRQ